jgi:hypothetical protein
MIGASSHNLLYYRDIFILAIATIRTALNFFLQQEIDKASARRAAPEQARSALSDIR